MPGIHHGCANNKHIYFTCSVGFLFKVNMSQTTVGPQFNTVLNVDREKHSVICLVVYLLCVLPHEMMIRRLKMVVCTTQYSVHFITTFRLTSVAAVLCSD